MSGFGDKIKGFFSMDDAYENGDDYDYGYDDDNDYEMDEPVSKYRSSSRTSRRSSDYDDVEETPVKPSRNKRAKVVSLNSSRVSYKAEIVTVRPSSLEDSKLIVDTLLASKAIVINFEGTNTDMAQRIIDSVSGACCAVDGTLKKISGYIYIVVPSSIGIDGDFADFTSPDYGYKGGRYQY